MDDPQRHLIIGELLQALANRLHRALYIRLNQNIQFLHGSRLNLIKQALQRYLLGAFNQLLTVSCAYLLSQLSRLTLTRRNKELLARGRDFGQSQNLYRHGRSGRLYLFPGVIIHGLDLTIGLADNNGISDMQRTVLYQSRRHNAAALIQLGLNYMSGCRAVRIGLVLFHIRHQQNHLQQRIDSFSALGGYGNTDRGAAPFLRNQLIFGQLLLNMIRIGFRLIHFIDCHDNLDTGRLGMVNRLDGLRHDTVIRRDNQDRDIRHLRAAHTHRGKRLMARRIQECNLSSIDAYNGRTDMLCDSSGFSCRHLGLTDRVQKRGLTMIDVSHNDNDRRTALEALRRIGLLHVFLEDVLFLHGLRQNIHIQRQCFGLLIIQIVVLAHQLALQHQALNNLRYRLFHHISKFTNRHDRRKLYNLDLFLNLLRLLHRLGGLFGTVLNNYIVLADRHQVLMLTTKIILSRVLGTLLILFLIPAHALGLLGLLYGRYFLRCLRNREFIGRSIVPCALRPHTAGPIVIIRTVAPLPLRAIASLSLRAIASLSLRAVIPLALRTITALILRTVIPLALRTVASLSLRAVVTLALRTVAALTLRTVIPLALRTIASLSLWALIPLALRTFLIIVLCLRRRRSCPIFILNRCILARLGRFRLRSFRFRSLCLRGFRFRSLCLRGLRLRGLRLRGLYLRSFRLRSLCLRGLRLRLLLLYRLCGILSGRSSETRLLPCQLYTYLADLIHLHSRLCIRNKHSNALQAFQDFRTAYLQLFCQTFNCYFCHWLFSTFQTFKLFSMIPASPSSVTATQERCSLPIALPNSALPQSRMKKGT